MDLIICKINIKKSVSYRSFSHDRVNKLSSINFDFSIEKMKWFSSELAFDKR